MKVKEPPFALQDPSQDKSRFKMDVSRYVKCASKHQGNKLKHTSTICNLKDLNRKKITFLFYFSNYMWIVEKSRYGL